MDEREDGEGPLISGDLKRGARPTCALAKMERVANTNTCWSDSPWRFALAKGLSSAWPAAPGDDNQDWHFR